MKVPVPKTEPLPSVNIPEKLASLKRKLGPNANRPASTDELSIVKLTPLLKPTTLLEKPVPEYACNRLGVIPLVPKEFDATPVKFAVKGIPALTTPKLLKLPVELESTVAVLILNVALLPLRVKVELPVISSPPVKSNAWAGAEANIVDATAAVAARGITERENSLFIF